MGYEQIATLKSKCCINDHLMKHLTAKFLILNGVEAELISLNIKEL